MSDPSKILKGIENVIISANDPGGLNCFPLCHTGFLVDGECKLNASKINKREGGGGNLQLGYELNADMTSFEVSAAEHAMWQRYIGNMAAFYLIGKEQTHVLSNALPTLSIAGDGSIKGSKKAILSAEKMIRSLDELTLGAPWANYNTFPVYWYNLIIQNIRQRNLIFSPVFNLGNFGAPSKNFDSSINRNVGLLEGDINISSILPGFYQMVEGRHDHVYYNFPSQFSPLPLKLNHVYLIECCLRVDGPNNVIQPFLISDEDVVVNEWDALSLFRNTNNLCTLRLKTGEGNIFNVTGAAQIFGGNWYYLSAIINRIHGLAYVSVNGQLGNPVGILDEPIELKNPFLIGAAPYNEESIYADMTIRSLRMYEFTQNEMIGNAAEVLSRLQAINQRHMQFEQLLYN